MKSPNQLQIITATLSAAVPCDTKAWLYNIFLKEDCIYIFYFVQC